MATGDFYIDKTTFEKYGKLYDSGLISPDEYKNIIKKEINKHSTVIPKHEYTEAELDEFAQLIGGKKRIKKPDYIPVCPCPCCGKSMTTEGWSGNFGLETVYYCSICCVTVDIKFGFHTPVPKEYFWNQFEKVKIDDMV